MKPLWKCCDPEFVLAQKGCLMPHLQSQLVAWLELCRSVAGKWLETQVDSLAKLDSCQPLDPKEKFQL
jgi:hypothetical protein